MNSEDRTAAKLKGFNCLLKFKDGEELYLKVPELDGDSESAREWFSDAEEFMNRTEHQDYFPLPEIAISRDAIKYIVRL